MYYLGVDSGGTKAAFLLADEQGRVYARHRAGGCCVLGARKAGVYQMMSEGIAEICTLAGIDASQIASVGLGISGYGEGEGSEQETLEACEEALAKGKAVCQCDTYVGWAGSLLYKAGINIISGTGSVVYGVDEEGRSARSSGWGAGCDEGSCSWFGQRLVEAFTKQADGRMPRTKLYDMFRSHFGISGDDAHFVLTLNREVVKGGRGLAQLQLFLHEIWLAGDPVANAIYAAGVNELWLGVQAVKTQLSMPDEGLLVSYSGGFFKTGECALAPLRQLASATGAKIVAPRFEPDVGALFMAIRHVNQAFDVSSFALHER